MRKIYANVVFRVIINADSDVEPQDILEELDFSFSAGAWQERADVVDAEIVDWTVTDTK